MRSAFWLFLLAYGECVCAANRSTSAADRA
jgi:hypothetical protein